ncbi:hypothetical protein PIB30_093926 [Stylosanthes scabra]|uniref:Uncharacterized protein n=1 Tax=Stylosanthes scabra TaxID=79078 RepID=A0ABU6VUI6_9FABA|nr:hypothetical protein [Stylosanthes scabra]
MTSTKVQQARKAHSSHVWPTSETKNEERKLAEQGTKFESNSFQKSTHMRGSSTLAQEHPRLDVLQKPRHDPYLLKSSRASTFKPTPRRAPRSLGMALTFLTKSRVHA